jgi:uncharacterized SAM-binding protein YcdF (DUF218 family)
VSGPLRAARNVAVVAAIAVVAYLAATFADVWLAARRDEARPAQAIVVLGAAQYDGRPSAVLRARLDHAAALWRRRVAPLVVVTGGRRPGDRFTEATASAGYLHRLGIPDAAILREVQGRNSWDSLAAAAVFLHRRGVRRVVLVSDPFHAARIRAMARELDLEAYTSPTRTSPIRGGAALRQMGRETLVVSLGRIVGYRRLMRIDRRVQACAGAAGHRVTCGSPRSGVV